MELLGELEIVEVALPPAQIVKTFNDIIERLELLEEIVLQKEATHGKDNF